MAKDGNFQIHHPNSKRTLLSTKCLSNPQCQPQYQNNHPKYVTPLQGIPASSGLALSNRTKGNSQPWKVEIKYGRRSQIVLSTVVWWTWLWMDLSTALPPMTLPGKRNGSSRSFRRTKCPSLRRRATMRLRVGSTPWQIKNWRTMNELRSILSWERTLPDL